MPRQANFQIENNFTRGLITEATGLNFPENSCTETFDCVFSEKGKVTRRLGFDYEGEYTTTNVNKTDGAIVEYYWNSAGGSGDTDIVVVQVGATLYYYKVVGTESLSTNKFSFTTNLLTYEVGVSTDVKGNPCQFTSGNGYLFVVHPLCKPIYISFTASVPSISENIINIQTRDLEGDKSDANYLNFGTRPSTNSDPHKYNLYNQGWYVSVRLDGGGGPTNVVTDWDSARSDFPSNSDIWYTFKDQNEEFNDGWIDRFPTTNTPAPKGHYILNEFSTNRSTLSGITVTERTSGNNRPSTVAFFASRVWYSGVNASEYNQKIYYSQIIDGVSQFGMCYQVNDPTAEDNSDLLPTDGGVIIIPDAGVIKKLFPMANSLIVFGTNGIWAIAGSEGVGFKATDYAIRKISSIETLSPLSFVDVYGAPAWWNTDGIFTITNSEVSGTEAVQSLTDDAIKTFFLDIPSDNKLTVKGVFNPRTRIVQWVYRSTLAADINEKYTYDRVLNFNILSKAFYPWTIGTTSTSPTVHGIIAYRGPLSQSQQVLVTTAAGTVTDVNGADVYVNDFGEVTSGYSFRYLAMNNTGASTWQMTWSQTIDDEYIDWTTDSQNLDFDSYFFTGYKIHGDAIRFFENNYLTITMSTEESSSCFVQGVWDYSNTPSSARFTNPQQIYISRPQRDNQQTRKKIRGRGRSLHYKFFSEAGKPFTIHGWTAWETQNANV